MPIGIDPAQRTKVGLPKSLCRQAQDMMMNLINILIGIIFLITGQKFFWLFIAFLGFLFGFEFATIFLVVQSYWKMFLISVICGLVGLGFAFFLQELAIIVSGFIAGGYIFLSLWHLAGLKMTEWWWLFFVASGIVASILLFIFFDPVLIVLSSFIGALVIIQELPFSPATKIFLFVILFTIGISLQSHHYFYAKTGPP
jgi:hypothetical protein